MRKPPNPGAFVFPRPCVGVSAECCRVPSCATGCDNAGGDGSPASCGVSDDDVRMRYGVYGDGPCPALISQGIVGELGGIRDSGVCPPRRGREFVTFLGLCEKSPNRNVGISRFSKSAPKPLVGSLSAECRFPAKLPQMCGNPPIGLLIWIDLG